MKSEEVVGSAGLSSATKLVLIIVAVAIGIAAIGIGMFRFILLRVFNVNKQSEGFKARLKNQDLTDSLAASIGNHRDHSASTLSPVNDTEPHIVHGMPYLNSEGSQQNQNRNSLAIYQYSPDVQYVTYDQSLDAHYVHGNPQRLSLPVANSMNYDPGHYSKTVPRNHYVNFRDSFSPGSGIDLQGQYMAKNDVNGSADVDDIHVKMREPYPPGNNRSIRASECMVNPQASVGPSEPPLPKIVVVGQEPTPMKLSMLNAELDKFQDMLWDDSLELDVANQSGHTGPVNEQEKQDSQLAKGSTSET